MLSTSPTQKTKRTECCVIETPTTSEPQYLIQSTSPVLTTGDRSSTTTTGLIYRNLRDITLTHAKEMQERVTGKKMITYSNRNKIRYYAVNGMDV